MMKSTSPHTGVLLLNVGTPDSPKTSDVRRYLREFLSDPRVIDIPPIARWLLLHLVILPFRPAKSSAAYKQVWLPEGSPLRIHSTRLAEGVQQLVGEGYDVQVAMRYGNPSLESVLQRFRQQGIDQLVVFPMYPQSASSSTGTSLEAVYRSLSGDWNVKQLVVLPPFYDDQGLIRAVAARGRGVLDQVEPDHVLFSFHGLPERHIRKSDETQSHCLASDNCCEVMCHANRHCYRAQCYVTAAGVAEALELEEGSWSVGFQSRLGRTPWIQPYTDEVLPRLVASGSRKVVVFCPAFVADCLETLEEIGIRAREDFLAAGGEVLELVPAVNDDPIWVERVAEMITDATGAFRTASAESLQQQG